VLNLFGSPTVGSDGESGGRCDPTLVHPNLRRMRTTNMPTLTREIYAASPVLQSLSLNLFPQLFCFLLCPLVLLCRFPTAVFLLGTLLATTTTGLPFMSLHMTTVYVFTSKSRLLINCVSGHFSMKHQLLLRRSYLLGNHRHRHRRLPPSQMMDTTPALNARA
jgi:hypothetical protein